MKKPDLHVLTLTPDTPLRGMKKQTKMTEMRLDEDGKFPSKPLVGWHINTHGDMFIVLEARYFESFEEAEKGAEQTLSLALPPSLALRLSEELKVVADQMTKKATTSRFSRE